jgi:hypothetical protein
MSFLTSCAVESGTSWLQTGFLVVGLERLSMHEKKPVPVLLHVLASSPRLDHYRERNADYCCGDSMTSCKAMRDIAFSQAARNVVDAQHVLIICCSRGKHFSCSRTWFHACNLRTCSLVLRLRKANTAITRCRGSCRPASNTARMKAEEMNMRRSRKMQLNFGERNRLLPPLS